MISLVASLLLVFYLLLSSSCFSFSIVSWVFHSWIDPFFLLYSFHVFFLSPLFSSILFLVQPFLLSLHFTLVFSIFLISPPFPLFSCLPFSHFPHITGFLSQLCVLPLLRFPLAAPLPPPLLLNPSVSSHRKKHHPCLYCASVERGGVRHVCVWAGSLQLVECLCCVCFPIVAIFFRSPSAAPLAHFQSRHIDTLTHTFTHRSPSSEWRALMAFKPTEENNWHFSEL